MLSPDQFELIEAYLNKQLSPIDRQSFEQELTTDDSLRRHVDTYRTLRLGLKQMAVEQQVRLAHERYQARPDLAEGESPAAVVHPLAAARTQPGWVRWAAAASVVVALGMGVYWYQHNQRAELLSFAETGLYQQDDQLTKGLPANLSAPDQQQLTAAIRDYKAGHYDAVIDRLRIPSADRASEPYRRYFLGLSYLANKQPAEAIRPLQDAVGSATGVLHQKADWFLALAYLENKQPTLSQPILARVRADSSHPYRSIAIELANRMK
jgi:hypothetical protein